MAPQPHASDVLRRHWSEQNEFDWIDALNGFEATFESSQMFAVDVPGRICVFGEHSDYVPYLKARIVTFASSEQRMRALISPRADGLVRIESSLDSCERCEFTIDDVRIDGEWLAALNRRENPSPHWSNYIRGAVSYLENCQGLEYGFDLYVHSSIPAASGTSSSSALTLCGLVAAHLSNDKMWGAESLARMGGEAEWYVGTRGGMMDHATMMFAEENSMLQMQFRPFQVAAVSNPDTNCNWYTVFTHPADKSGSARDAFNELAYVQQSTIRGLLEEIGFQHGDGDVKWQGVADLLPEFIETEEFGRVQVRDRFRYVMREFSRVNNFVTAMEDSDFQTIAKLLDESWKDTRTLLGTHTPEMEEVANTLRQKEGVVGVKVMGAGFGGSLLVCARQDSDLASEAVEHTPGSGVRLVEFN